VLVFRKSYFELVQVNPLQQWNVTQAPVNPDDLKPLQGNWNVLSGVYNTTDQTGFVPIRARIESDRLHLTFRKPSGGEERDAALIPTIRVNPEARPKQIDIHTGFGTVESVKHGIYSLQGDTLLIALQENPSKPRPADFTDNAKEQQSLMILQRDKAMRAKGGDLEKLQGAWEVVSRESASGVERSPDLGKVQFVFKGNKLSAGATNRDVTNMTYTVRLHEDRSPKEIEIVFSDSQTKGIPTGRGIYSLNGDALLLCLTFDEKEARPTEFVAAQGSKRVLHILRRDALPNVVRPPRDPNAALRPDAGMFERIDDLNRKLAEMQAEIAHLREELRKSQGKPPQ
jgi:uncharacterized protein (TIGR03067 family)